MTLAQDIISCRKPNFDLYLSEGHSLDDIDEYGFTPLIETVITQQPKLTLELLNRGADVNKADVTGRTALHWAVDNNDLTLCKILLESGADPNAYTYAGLSILVYPVLRDQDVLKQLLYQYGAKLDFALDFIFGKLLGHRFELSGDVDIVNAKGEFIELDYEGFILEFTVAELKDSLRRFTSSFSTRHLRDHFPYIHEVMDGFDIASKLLSLQCHPMLLDEHHDQLKAYLKAPVLILPAASRGHAMGFVRIGEFWGKVDRGEHSLKEGSVTIYQIGMPENINLSFILDFLYKKQPRKFFHENINHRLALKPIAKLPIPSQITGNCSWANIQAIMPLAYVMQSLQSTGHFSKEKVLDLYQIWLEWDKDRALDETIQRFYQANPIRKASLAAMLGGVLYQTCDDDNNLHLQRAEKILSVLTIPDYYYILQSYLDEFCINQLTRRGNNLLKLLEDCGYNPNIGVNPIATGLKD